MNRREQDRGRRPPKRSRSPDEHDRSPRGDKRRRPQANERQPERSLSPRTTRSSTVENGSREERHHRRDERRERESRSRPQGTPILSCSCTNGDLDEPRGYERDRKVTITNSKSEYNNRPADQKPPSTKQLPSTTIQTPSKPKAITAAALLEEGDDPPISKLMGFSRFKSTKGKKHDDYGAVDVIKKRTYRQYMNRPGGFNRPLDH
jgi:U4/U6.U5 tri-snRNP-associated protein 3